VDRDQTGRVRTSTLTTMPMTEAPRRIAELCRLTRTLRYRLALEAGLEQDDSITEQEFLRLPAIQQASVLARLLKEYDEAEIQSEARR
jgi:hypothetical protein